MRKNRYFLKLQYPTDILLSQRAIFFANENKKTNFKKYRKMETKQVKMTKVIKFSTRATLRDLGKYTGVMPAKLAEKAQALGIACEEPQIWQYTGSDGNPDTEFLLDICVPVSSFSGDPGEFSFYELPAISCLSEMHHGAWMDMETTY